MTIVGVAPNMRMNAFGPGQDSAGFYVPLRQVNARLVTITVQTAGANPIAMSKTFDVSFVQWTRICRSTTWIR